MTSSTGCKRIDALGIAAELHDAVAHRRQVDDARHAGEVLQQHARRHERDLLLAGRAGRPGGQRARCRPCDEGVVLAPQQVLEQDLQRERQPGHAGKPGLLERRQAVEVDGVVSDRQRLARGK